MQHIIHIENGITRHPMWRMAEPVNFDLLDKEHLAIVGPNGGGKSMLVDILTNAHPLLMKDPAYDFSPSTKRFLSQYQAAGQRQYQIHHVQRQLRR